VRQLSTTLLTLLAGVAIAATAGGPARSSETDPWADLEHEILARGLDPGLVVIPGRLTDEIRQWIHTVVSPADSQDAALRQLLAALIDPKGLELVYDPSFTGTAQEIWESRRANCLGFTHLFVGLSRELGISTYYVSWSTVERFRREGDLVLVSGHVSAGWGTAHDSQVLEFGAVDGFEAKAARRISDLNATARHYSNRSAERLQAGENHLAIAEAELATQLDPGLADAWVNLGVSRRRSGDLEGAERAYRRATLADPDHVPAYQNLSVLMQLQGAQSTAQEIMALLDRRDNRNPFTYLSLGDHSLDAGREVEADRFYRRASKLGPKLAETRAARGIWALEIGDREKASKWLRRAQAIDPEESRTRRLAQKLSRSDDSSE